MRLHARRISSLLSPVVAVIGIVAIGHPLHAQQLGSIRGRVMVEGVNRPLGSAQVSVVGTSIGAQTNDDGEYRLNNVPPGPRQVRVQRIGFAPATSPVTVVAGQTATVDFTIREAPVSLEQVVVTATGDVRRKEIANSMSTISAETIENAPVTNAQQLLAAQTPGVTVLANTGQPGGGGAIRLRGNNSISQGNTPIVYVDGVRIYNGDTPIVPNARQIMNPYNDIRAEDIERVEVVKGAAATTLYGTEASGGVIQIFTKRGQAGRPQWTFEAVGGTNDLNYLDVPGDPTAVYLKDCRGPELYGIDVVTTSKTFGQEIKFEDATCPSSGKWIRTGATQRYALGVGGGGDVMRYFLNGNFSDEQGAIDPGQYRTGGFRGNFSFRPLRELELALNSSYQRGDQTWVPDGNLANGFLLNVARGTGGNYKSGTGCSSSATFCMNNAEALAIDTKSYTDHFISGFTVNYAPIEAWTNRLTIGFDYNGIENRSIIPFGHSRNPTGTLSQQDWTRKNLSIDLASTYRRNFGSVWVSTTSLGGQVFQDNLFQTNVTATEFSAPGEPVLTSGAIRTVPTDTRRRVVNAGLFAQEQLGWRDRVFLTLGLRVDGNSAFGEDFGLQPYPKVGVSYVLSEHGFWPSDKWETFKLRAALGESGKAPGAFDAVRTWNPIAGDEAKPGFTPNQIGNKDLGPERTRELELGFETSAYAGRYSLDFTWFKTNTLDALIQVRYPPSQGILNRQLENVGEIENRGIEARAEAGFVRRRGIDWRGRVNYTNIDSKAVDLGGEPAITIGVSTEVRVGYPVTSVFARKVTNPNAIADPIVTTDPVFLGPTFPEQVIGLGTTLTLWDRLSLDMLGEFQEGAYNQNWVGYQNANRGNWRPCYAAQKKLIAAAKGDASALSDVTALERVRCAVDRTVQLSDAWFEPTDFFRMRYVTLSYRLPPRVLRGMQNATLTLSGRNLFYSSDYSGLDPESADQSDSQVGRREYYVLPQLRSFSLALRVGW
jgi:TonB-linked SusC/RagA family outer membrane protein